MELSIPSKLTSLKKALGFSALESVGSRVFDFVTLWIVLNTLTSNDLALFGLATSALFFFNAIFVAPETALLRFQKEWAANEELGEYISSFLFFSGIKIFIHYIGAVTIYLYFGNMHWLVYAVIFSTITQQIQLAEIARINMRMDLRQEFVAKFELVSKIVLCSICLVLFKKPSLVLYFFLYLTWSALSALFWILNLSKTINVSFFGVKKSLKNVYESMLGFSLWSHVSGILTFYIYNSNLLFLNFFNATVNSIALYTSVTKVANLFFVIPMFFQSFVPVVLSNSEHSTTQQFRKLLFANGFLSLVQLVFFIVFGFLMAPFFGVKDQQQIHDFYYLGLIVNIGIFLLNISRPLSTFLLIRSHPKRVMFLIFIPSALFATVFYSFGAHQAGVYGCAIGSALTYAFMAVMLIAFYFSHKKHN